MVAISVALVATVGTNSLIARTDARSAVSESARSVTDTIRRIAANAPVGSVNLHGYYHTPDAFAGIQVEAFSKAQAQTTCEVVGRAAVSTAASGEEIYTLDPTGTLVAYWVYRVDSSLQCPQLSTQPLYQNRLTNELVRITDFQAQMNSYECDPTANCATKQQLRYRFTLELAKPLGGRSAETRSASTTVSSSVPIGMVNTGITPVNILTTELPPGEVGAAYSKEILGEGGRLPYSWSYTGSLVAGLSLTQDGTVYRLTGTPSATGTSIITVTLRDGGNPQLSDVQEFSFSIGAAGTGGGTLQILTVAVPIGTQGSPYSTTLTATGGVGQLNWSIISGALPPGVTLNAQSGVMSGIPTAPGTYNFTVHVADTADQSDTQALSLLIMPELGGGGGGTMPGGPGGLGGHGTGGFE